MAHEIESHDGVVLHKVPAWHGLGTVVQDAPTPTDALAIAGLDWQVGSKLFGQDAERAAKSLVLALSM